MNRIPRSEGGARADQSAVDVKLTSLESVMSTFKLKKIDLLKIDVEGAETGIFERFSLADFGRIDPITVEFVDGNLNPSNSDVRVARAA